MSERKILFFVFFVIIYCCYNVQMWFLRRSEDTPVETGKEVAPQTRHVRNHQLYMKKSNPKTEHTSTFQESCGAVEVFTQNLPSIEKTQTPRMSADNNTMTAIGITVFLLILILNAVLDVLKVKEEERARRKLNPDGERRQSLAEFANKKNLRRESSKFGQQLFQIAESLVTTEGEPPCTRQTRPYTRGESTNSYLSEKKTSEGSAPASIGDCGDAKLVKRQSLAKLFGARPAPMVRRSSFPVLPLNPEVHALMLGHRQASVDSDDDCDSKGRRVRIIRRY